METSKRIGSQLFSQLYLGGAENEQGRKGQLRHILEQEGFLKITFDTK